MESSAAEVAAAVAAAVATSTSMVLAELRRQSEQLTRRDDFLFKKLEKTMESASAAPSICEQIQSLLDRNYERQGERYDFLFKKLEKRLLTRQIQRQQERDEKASQESAALMGELSSLKEALEKNTAKLSSLEQTITSVQTTVKGVESTGKETKQGLAAIRAIVGKNELTCNQTKDLVVSFGTKLAVFEERVPVPDEAEMAAQVRSLTTAIIDNGDDDNEEEKEELDADDDGDDDVYDDDDDDGKGNSNGNGDNDNDNDKVVVPTRTTRSTVQNNNENNNKRLRRCAKTTTTSATTSASRNKSTLTALAPQNKSRNSETMKLDRPDWGHLVPDSDLRLRYDGRPNDTDSIGVGVSVVGTGQDQWEGWWKQSIERLNPDGKKKRKLIDHYWYAPPNGTKLRSISQVREFLLRSNDSVAVATAAKDNVNINDDDDDDDDDEQPPPNDDDDGYDEPSERCDFANMLYAMVEDCTFDEDLSKIVAWQPHGLAFKVHNREEMEKILPKWFKMKYESWCKQLERWGFWKLRRGKDRDCWYHTKFVHRSSYVHARDAYKQMSKNDFSESMPEYLSAREEPDLDTLSTEDNRISPKQRKRKAGVIDQENTGNKLK